MNYFSDDDNGNSWDLFYGADLYWSINQRTSANNNGNVSPSRRIKNA